MVPLLSRRPHNVPIVAQYGPRNKLSKESLVWQEGPYPGLVELVLRPIERVGW